MGNKYTSLKLSKKLKENGFDGDSNLVRNGGVIRMKRQDDLYEEIKTYDILNDLCVKYVKEIFGEKFNRRRYETTGEPVYLRDYTEKVLHLLQQGKKQETEEYIRENCIYNSINKLGKNWKIN